MDQDNQHVGLGMLITFVFMTAFIGGMWLITPQPESFPIEKSVITTIIEDETEMKYEQFAAASSTNDDLEDLQRFRNIAYWDGTYYWGVVSGADFIIKTAASITGASSTAHTYAITAFDNVTNIVTRIVVANSKVFVVAAISTYRASDTGSRVFRTLYNITDGGAWADDQLVGSLVAVEILIDIQSINQTTKTIDYVIWEGIRINMFGQSYDDGGSDYENLLVFTAIDDNAFYGGYDDGSGVYYFIIVNDADEFKIKSWTEATNTYATVETLSGVSKPTSFTVTVQLYWKQGRFEYILDEDHFYLRKIGNTTWSDYSDTGTTTNGIVWDYDSNNKYIINYLIWKDGIYKILDAGYPYRIQTFTDDAYTGWSDWFSNGADTIYQMVLTAFPASKCLVTKEFLTPPKVDIISTVIPITNQLLILYDENDVLRAYTLIKDFKKFKNAQYKYICESPFKYDLDAKVVYTPSAVDAPDILKYVIDTYCKTLFYGTSSINTTPATTYSFPFKKTVKDVFLWAVQQEGYYISSRPDGEVYFDQMTDSGDTLIFDTDAMEEPGVFDRPLKLSYIYIEGAMLNGVRLTSEKYGEPNNGTYRDKFHEINNQTDLDSMRDKILAQKNKTITEYSTTTYSVKYFDQGTTTVLTDANYSIDTDTYYIVGTVWNLLPGDKMCVVKLMSALYIPSLRDKTTGNPKIDGVIQNVREDTTNQINNVNQDIEQVESDVNYSSGQGISPAFTKIDSDDNYGANPTIDNFKSGLPSWTNNDGADCTSSYLTSKTLGTRTIKHVLQQYDNGGATLAQVYKTIDNSLVISGWFADSDITKGVVVAFNEGATRIGILKIEGSEIRWYDGANQALIVPVNDTWYHYALVFSATDDDVDIYLNGFFDSTQSLENNITTAINKITINTGNADNGYYGYSASLYYGNSLADAFSSLYDGTIITKGIIIEDGVIIKGTASILVETNKANDIGTATAAFDTIYADDFTNVASKSKYIDIDSKSALEVISTKGIDWKDNPIAESFMIGKETHHLISDSVVKSYIFAAIKELKEENDKLKKVLGIE